MDKLHERVKGYIQMEEISRLGMDKTKHCRYHRSHGHNTGDCWALKDKMEKLIQVGYLAQFMKKPDDNPTRGRRETIVAKVEMPAEEGTKWIKEADKGVTRKGVNINLSKSKKMSLPSGFSYEG
ncbi:hypothetical protein JHK87_043025 [Glycine soja]|nr:hypothetical protein JHK87_043025 [Glycine soja]